MNNITIGRYSNAERGDHTYPIIHCDAEGNEVSRELGGYDGWIEGVRDDGSSWIMWMDDHGSPQCFYGKREPDGGVIGEPVMLA